ncbi:MAG: Ig-like domain-containing protein [Syntrophomonadaceae bacterium]|nr:Ig-like domain-containing protein [Syntrophomonadaceae bacterium]
MITIGPGKEDSDVVTFTFTADLTGKAVDPTKVPGGPPTGVTLDQNTIRRPIGSTFQLAADIAPFNATDKDVTWSSSDTRIATVDSHGLVTVVGPGTAIITVKTVVGGYTDVCIVNGPDEAETSQNDDSVVVSPTDNEVLESIQEPPTPETEPQDPAKDLDNNPSSAVSGLVPEVPEESQVPEDKAQFLIEKDALTVDTAADIAMPEPGIQNSQVFEVSADTVPLPLKENRDWVNVYTSGSLFCFPEPAGDMQNIRRSDKIR